MNGKLKDFLIQYSKNGRIPFHMPGHKRASKMLYEIDPFDVDFTEIEGLDNLHHPEGILRDAMEEAARFYGTKRTWFLVNGSSCGILAAITATTKIGDHILIGRNCHKSVYHGALLRNLQVDYVFPEVISDYGIQGGYSSEQIERKLSENPAIRVVVLTSPTYDGVVSDIEKIAEIVHDFGGILIVDEAHGAHFCLEEKKIKPAYRCGADLVIESLHKTLPALTQSAVLHLQGDRIEEWRIQKELEVFETSSPSYLMMASIDDCLKKIQKNGKERMDVLLQNIEAFKEQTKELKHIRVPGKELMGKNAVFAYDETKLVCCMKGTNLSGRDLSEILRNEYNIELEMETPTYALALCSIGDSKNSMKALADALIDIDKRVEASLNDEIENMYGENEREYSIYEATIREKEMILMEKSVGRVSGEFVYFYPPGIPVLVPGEVISRQVLEAIGEAKNRGIAVNGLQDYEQKVIQVIKK